LEVIKALLSFLSYVYHGLLCLLVLALSGVAMAAGAKTLQLSMLPWSGTTLLYTMFFGSLAGLVIVVMAIRGTLRPVFFLWSLVVVILLAKGYVFSGYHFSPGEFRNAGYLRVGSLIAMFGAWTQMSRRRTR